MGASPGGRRVSKPWYGRADELVAQVDGYMAALRRLPEDAPALEQIKVYGSWSRVRLIFESNRMEHAGQPTLADTKRVVIDGLDGMPEFALPPSVPRAGWAAGTEFMDSFFDAALDMRTIGGALAASSGKPGLPNLRFAGGTRPTMEVLRHAYALIAADVIVVDQNISELEHQFYVLQRADIASGAQSEAEARAEWDALDTGRPYGPVPLLTLTEDNVRELHWQLATNLLPADVVDPAGSYRTQQVFVGLDRHFLAPELVPSAMEAFVARAAQDDATFGGSVRKAAWVAHRFVDIHPFGDFNGRLSRILMNMVLWRVGLPFSVALRSDAKHRKRYMQALKRGDRGDLSALTALIAQEIVDAFEEIDRNLTLAGLPTIGSLAPRLGSSE